MLHVEDERKQRSQACKGSLHTQMDIYQMRRFSDFLPIVASLEAHSESESESEFLIPVSQPRVDPSPAGASGFVRDTLRQIVALHYRSTERWMLPRSLLQVERAMIGWPGERPRNVLASNTAAKYVVARKAIELLDEQQNQHPGRRYYLVTLISDRWITYSHKTKLWLGGMIATSRPVMQLAGFDGWLGIVEIQTIMEAFIDKGRWLLPHVHAVAWSDDPDFDYRAAARRMNASDRLYNRIGAPCADIRHWEQQGKPLSRATNIAAYVFKGASLGKYRRWDGHSYSGFYLEDTKLSPIAAVRQNEILSSVELMALIFAGGTGAAIRNELRRHLNSEVPGSATELTPDHARRFWDRVRSRPSSKRYHTYGQPTVYRDAHQRPWDQERKRAAIEQLVSFYRPHNPGMARGEFRDLIALMVKQLKSDERKLSESRPER